jgi:hypothetical protein
MPASIAQDSNYVHQIDILPYLDLWSPLARERRGFLRGPLSGPFGGFLLLTAYFAVHLAD